MIIYPDIELHNGKCVTLKHGSISKPQIFQISPLEAAKKFEEAGAEWLHVIDLDRVFGNGGDNSDVIRQIIKQANIPVQVGGGIQAESTIEHWIADGAERVVLGTAAVLNKNLMDNVCAHYPDKIVVSIDARDGKVVTHGWERVSAFSALDLAKYYENSGVAGIIYTDIDLYDELIESSMANTTQLASKLSCPVISSGTISSLNDVSTLSQLPNISGVVTGWALFNEKVDLAEALAIANQRKTKAEFI